jgi:flagellin
MAGISLDAASLRGIFSLKRANRDVQTSLERLSTGKKLNRASDDPAGSIAADNMAGQIKSIEARIRSISQEDGYIGAREGGYSVVSDMLTELTGLIVTAANRDGLSDTEKKALQQQADGILKGINNAANTTTFKGQAILTELNTARLGSSRPVEGGGTLSDGNSLASLGDGGTLNLIDGDLETAQKVVEAAASSVSTMRATFGAKMKANDSAVAALQEELANVSGARSAIVDTDYAEETAKLVRAQVQQEMSTFALQINADQRKALLDMLKPMKL